MDPLPGRHDCVIRAVQETDLRRELDETLDTLLEEVLADAHSARLVQDAALAQSGREADGFWFLRENIPRAQRLDGESLKHDISVPVAALPQFVEAGGGVDCSPRA